MLCCAALHCAVLCYAECSSTKKFKDLVQRLLTDFGLSPKVVLDFAIDESSR